MSTVPNQLMIQQAAQKLADLWADQLQKPFNKDNGDDNTLLFMLSTLNTQHSQQGISQVNIDAFKASLISIIVDQLSDEINSRYFSLGTDYHPDPYLSEAAAVAGIPSGAFPWKSYTMVCLEGNQISYHFGYSAQHQTIVIQP